MCRELHCSVSMRIRPSGKHTEEELPLPPPALSESGSKYLRRSGAELSAFVRDRCREPVGSPDGKVIRRAFEKRQVRVEEDGAELETPACTEACGYAALKTSTHAL